MAEQETRDTFLLRDADGALFFPPKSLSLSGGDTFWTWVADSDTPPFLLFQRFASEVSAVKPDLLEEFVRERSYFAAPDALLLRLRANASVES